MAENDDTDVKAVPKQTLKSQDEKLDAELHEGYDPSAEFQTTGLLMGSVAYPAYDQMIDAENLNVSLDPTADTFKNVNQSDNAAQAFTTSPLATIDAASRPVLPAAAAAIIDNAAPANSNFAPTQTPQENIDANALQDSQVLDVPAPNGGDSGGTQASDVPNRPSIGTPRSGGGGDPPPNPEMPPVDDNDDDGTLTPTPIPPNTPVVQISHGPGEENQGLPLAISLTADTNATTVIVIGNLPPGSILSAGTLQPNGTWALTPAQLPGLTLTPPDGYSGNFNLSVVATSTRDGLQSSGTNTSAVMIEGVASTPTLSVQPASGDEDTAIPLNINAALTDNDGSEILSITIAGVPAGASLSAGINNGNGTWTLTPAQLSGLTLTPPDGFSGNINLSVTATSSENGTNASTSAPLVVSVDGVASAPTLAVQPANGDEDTAIALNINAALTDNDGSETLAITIAGIPAGATLSAGINNGDGTWTLTPAQLAGLTLTAAANFSGNINLSVTATSSENDTNASTSAPLVVSVDGVASAPTLAVQPANGDEDTAIALNINAALTDNDGSETLAITIGNVPAGASLSAGINNGNGTWTLTPAQLSGLTLTPPDGFSGNINLSVTATSSENGTTANTTVNLPVSVDGVASAPTLSVQAANGDEDTAIPLNINAALTDNDGSETLAITIAGIPAGATLSAGINNGDGTWTLTPAQLAGLTLTPPDGFSGNINLSVTATSFENGTMASATAPLAVSVDGVASTPTLSVQAANGDEDTAIPLNINAALTDNDGSETLAITIGNVPAGAFLSAGVNNGDGTWTLTPAQLAGLTLTPPDGFSGNINLSVTATSFENGTMASATAPLAVSVDGVASVPTLSVQPASGDEDTAIALNINAALTDNDGSEILSITIGNVPAGAILSAGVNNGDGTWTLTPAQLAGLTLTPPDGYSGNINLSVTATSSENGTNASTSAPLVVSVDGVASAPTLAVQPASGDEDTAIVLNINAALTDNDGSETLSIVIGNVPAGAMLSAGVNNGDGTWTLTAAQLSGLTLTPPANYSGSFNLSVTATSSENGTNAITNATLAVSVDGVADAPTLTVQPASGGENTAIALDITAALTDNDGSETLSIVIGNVPAGAILSAGINNGNGTWTLTPAQLSGLTITTPAHASGVFALSINAVSTDGGDTTITQATLSLTVDGINDPPTLTVQAAAGNEDTAIALVIDAQLVNPDGTETLSIVIGNVPTGATLSAGINNGDGTWTLTPAQLAGLALTPPANASGNYTLSVTAIVSENGDTTSTSANLNVNVQGVPDGPTVSVMPASGDEGQAISLNINAALTDNDGSEILSITIAGIPAGATLSAGINNGDGTWTLTPAQLAGLTLTPAAGFSGALNLNIIATASENGTSSSTSTILPVTVDGVASAPSLIVQPASGDEDTAIVLNINAGLSDNDGSEALSIVIGSVPAGATLSAGINNGDGTWTLTPAQLAGLTLTPAANYSGSFNLSVAATSSENGTTSNTNATLSVTVAGVADAPTLSVQAAVGVEDAAIALNISAGLTDTDGSEILAITIAGVPAGATLSAGINNGNGTWTLTAAQLSGLTLTPPNGFSGALNLSVTATASENGTTANTTVNLPVSVGGVADAPTLSVQAAVGLEDAAIPLNINAGLSDNDGSETLSIVIGSVPAGATLSAGINNGDGTWTLTPAQLAGLTLTAAANFSGAFALTITATSSENGTTSTISTSLPVTVDGAADTPTLSALNAVGVEDGAIPLTIIAGLADTDGSETLSILISGVPAGASLSAGLYAGNGQWSLSPAQLAGLILTPPANFSGIIALQVSAVSTENNGTHTVINVPVSVTVTPVADVPILGTVAAIGREDTAIALNISAALNDTDGSETLSVTISGVPAGATLSAGINNGNGTWTLTSAQLANLHVTPPANSDADFTLMITATSHDGVATTTTSSSMAVTVTAAADTPTVSAANTSGAKNTQVAVTVNGAVTDTDGSESVTFLIGGVPDGFALNQGVNNGNNTWTLTSAQLSNLRLISPYNFEGRVHMTATAVSHDNDNDTALSAPINFNVGVGNAALGIQLNLGLGIGIGGIGVGTTLGVGVNLGGLLDSGGVVAYEDSVVALTDAPLLLNLVGAISYITISGLPAGASLSAGTNLGGGAYRLVSGQLNNLNLILPPNSDEDFTLTITARLLSLLTVGLATTVVHVIGVADQPTLSVAAATGTEDGAVIPVTVTSALTDTDGSETLSFMITNLTAGFVPTVGINNGNGTWSLTAAQIGSLGFRAPANFSGDANYTIVAVSTEREGDSITRTANGTIHVNAVADAPTISAAPVTGNEDQNIPLNLNISLTDTDGSEQISAVTISGLPAGFTLIGATDNLNGTFSVNPNALSQVQLVPPLHWSGDLNLSVTATSRESTGATASTTTTIPVHVNAVADAPVLTATDATATSGQDVSLHINAALTDTDGSETLSIVISGVPNDMHLSAGLNNGDGTWTLRGDQLNDLRLVSHSNFVGDLNMGVTAYSREGNGSTASVHQDFSVHILQGAQFMMNDDHANNNVSTSGWLGDGDSAGAGADAAAMGAGNAAYADAQSHATSGNDYDHAFSQQTG
ncbi:MAG: Ig-like domain-containing protein [Pseudomonadota bacterium]